MNKMTDSRAADLLAAHNEWRRGGDGPQTEPVTLGLALERAVARLREPAGVGGEWVLVPRVPTEAMHTAHAMYGDTSDWWNAVLVAAPQPPAEAQHTPIADLLAGYEANGCDHTDMAWVRAAARRYVETMPDSQARCLLHVLAQEPAEAQAQGGGEVVYQLADEYGSEWMDCSKAVFKWWQGKGRKSRKLYTAPPSAPVGVEGLVAGCRVLLEQYEASGDFTMGGQLTNRPFLMIRAALNELFGNSEKLPPCRCSDGPYHYPDCPHRDPEWVDPFAALGAAMSGRALAQQPAAVDESLPDFLDRIADELVSRDTRAGTFAPGIAESLRGRAIVLRTLAAQPGGSDHE